MKKYVSFILACIFVSLSCFSSFAALASGSNVDPYSTSKSNSVYEELVNRDLSGSSDMFHAVSESVRLASSNNALMQSPVPLVVDLPSFANTIDRTKCTVFMDYYDMSNVLHTLKTSVGSDGWFNFSQRPNDFAKLNSAFLRIPKSALPNSGKYQIQVGLYPEGGGPAYWDYSRISMIRNYMNANQTYSVCTPAMQMNFNDVVLRADIDFGSVDYINIILFAEESFGFQFNGMWKVGFTKISESSSVDGSTPGIDLSDDSSSLVADNTASIVDTQNEILETLHELIQHISDQLYAFWNQLAGEFTNLYWLMQSQHEELMTALRDGINVSLEANFSDLIENDNANHQEQLDNDNANTDQITNGYDSSTMDSVSDKLNGSLSDISDSQKTIFDSVSGYINDFQFPDFGNIVGSNQLVAALVFFGNFMQDVFDAMGPFNSIITVSLTFIFVLMLLGYHRFRA